MQVTLYKKKGMSTIAYIQSTDILPKAAELLNLSVDNSYSPAVDYWNGILDRSLGTNRSLKLADLPEMDTYKKSKKRILRK